MRRAGRGAVAPPPPRTPAGRRPLGSLRVVGGPGAGAPPPRLPRPLAGRRPFGWWRLWGALAAGPPPGLLRRPGGRLAVVEVRQRDPGEPLTDVALDLRQRLLLGGGDQHEGIALRLG